MYREYRSDFPYSFCYIDSMVMSTNQKSDRTVPAPKEGTEVNIPKEELEKCVEDGFSSSRIADKFGTTIKNVRRHLTVYKLTMSTRFEKISGKYGHLFQKGGQRAPAICEDC